MGDEDGWMAGGEEVWSGWVGREEEVRSIVLMGSFCTTWVWRGYASNTRLTATSYFLPKYVTVHSFGVFLFIK